MKILFITTFYKPNEVGGAEVQTRNNVEFVTGYADVRVLTFDSDLKDTEEVQGVVKVTRLHIKHVSDKLLNYIAKRRKLSKIKILALLFTPGIFLQIKKKLLKRKKDYSGTDIIHISGNLILIPSLRLFSFLRKEFPQSKIIYTIHDHYSIGRRSKYPHKRRFIYSYIYQAILKKNIDYFICPSEYIRHKSINDFKIDTQRFIKISNSVPYESHCFNERQEDIIMYAGSVEYLKGVDIITDAFIKLRGQKADHLKLLIVGDGDYKSELKRKLSLVPEESYKFMEKVPHDKIMELFRSATFIILASRYDEIFGMSLVEGFYNGALPLGSKAGAIPETLNYDNDLIFDNSNELADKLNNFLSNHNKIKNKMLSLEEHMNYYSPSVVSKEYLKFYKNLVK